MVSSAQPEHQSRAPPPTTQITQPRSTTQDAVLKVCGSRTERWCSRLPDHDRVFFRSVAATSQRAEQEEFRLSPVQAAPAVSVTPSDKSPSSKGSLSKSLARFSMSFSGRSKSGIKNSSPPVPIDEPAPQPSYAASSPIPRPLQHQRPVLFAGSTAPSSRPRSFVIPQTLEEWEAFNKAMLSPAPPPSQTQQRPHQSSHLRPPSGSSSMLPGPRLAATLAASPGGAAAISCMYLRLSPTFLVDWVDLVEFDDDDAGEVQVTRAIDHKIPFANGIAMSPNGRTVAVASSTKISVSFYDRDVTTNKLTYSSGVDMPFHPDNIAYDKQDGTTLYASGEPFYPDMIEVSKGKKLYSPSWVVAISPRAPGVSDKHYQEDAPVPSHARASMSPSWAVRTIYQSDGSGFSASATGFVDKEGGKLFAAGLFEPRGILQCK
ncbi:hypothetical protein FRC04_009280 [Tulasnella sp. 424]|nr:hypothetical protein FRC04_009280 [Tulasnella sp. 424]